MASLRRWCDALRASLTRLRVYESELVDLAYSENDPRGVRTEAEMPPEWLAMRAELQARACYCAGRVAGEDHAVAKMYSDAPTRADNPYSIDRARFAVLLSGRL